MFMDRSALTSKCIDILRGVNKEIEYTTLLRAMGVQSRREAAGALATARRVLQKDKICFLTMRGIGLRRLTDSEKVDSVEKNKRQVHNASKRGIRQLNAIAEPMKMSNMDQQKATIYRTIFEATRTIVKSQPSTLKAAPLPLPKIALLK